MGRETCDGWIQKYSAIIIIFAVSMVSLFLSTPVLKKKKKNNFIYIVYLNYIAINSLKKKGCWHKNNVQKHRSNTTSLHFTSDFLHVIVYVFYEKENM